MWAIATTAGLCVVRLHDLRHGQASLMLAAGVPMAVVSKRLGHSQLAITADTYSHLLGGVGRQAAEAAAALVPRPPRDTRVTPGCAPRDTDVTRTGVADPASEADQAQSPGQRAPATGLEPVTVRLTVGCSAN